MYQESSIKLFSKSGEKEANISSPPTPGMLYAKKIIKIKYL
jgi:hypothetical protein